MWDFNFKCNQWENSGMWVHHCVKLHALEAQWQLMSEGQAMAFWLRLRAHACIVLLPSSLMATTVLTLCPIHRDLLFRPQTYHALSWLRIFPCECLFWPLIPKIYQVPPVDAFIAYLLCGSITVVVEWLICKVHFSARMKVPWGQRLWLSCFPLTLMSSTALWCIPDTQDIPIFVYWWIEWTNEWLNQASVVQT